MGYEYLLAIMADIGRAKDKARLQVSLDSKPADIEQAERYPPEAPSAGEVA